MWKIATFSNRITERKCKYPFYMGYIVYSPILYSFSYFSSPYFLLIFFCRKANPSPQALGIIHNIYPWRPLNRKVTIGSIITFESLGTLNLLWTRYYTNIYLADFEYCMPKKSCPFLSIELLNVNGQDYLETQYCTWHSSNMWTLSPMYTCR